MFSTPGSARPKNHLRTRHTTPAMKAISTSGIRA